MKESRLDYISKRSDGLYLVGDGLALASIAKEAKAKDKEVINATVGTLYNEDGSFYVFKSVDNFLKNAKSEQIYTYSSADGGLEYASAVTEWVFGKDKEYISNNMFVKAISTPGGTGAVNNALYIFANKGDDILIPNYYWAPYANMAKVNENNVITYEFFKDGKFNLPEFMKKADEIVLKCGRLCTILNDPCNNPTGYTLTNEEFVGLIDYLNTLAVPVCVVYDIAYFDYYLEGMEKAREKFALMTKANENIIFNIAYSASKSFSIYGLRLGAEIFLGKCKDAVKDAFNASIYLARTRWSNASKPAISLLIATSKDAKLKDEVQNEIRVATEMLKKRIELFKKEAKEEDLDIFDVRGGFFACIKCADGVRLANALIDKKVYVLPFSNAIRVALCSLPLNEVKGLAHKIKNTLDELK